MTFQMCRSPKKLMGESVPCELWQRRGQRLCRLCSWQQHCCRESHAIPTASAVMPQWLRKDRGITWAEFGAGRQNRVVCVWEELFGLGCLEVMVTKRVCRELELGGLRLKSSVLYKPGAYCGLGEESPRDGPSCGWDW